MVSVIKVDKITGQSGKRGSAPITLSGDTLTFSSGLSYSTGTFTPLVNDIPVDGAGTYSAQSGLYTKIGNMVFIDFTLTYAGAYANIGTNQVYVTMPFTAKNVTNYKSITAMGYMTNSGTVLANMLATITANSNKLYFWKLPGSGRDNLTGTAHTGHDTHSGNEILRVEGSPKFMVEE
jgi:hypothetical protein